LRERERLEKVDGPAYITYLINHTPTHVNCETYARMVERAAIRRRLLGAAADIAQTALEANTSIQDVIDKAESALYGATEGRMSRDLIPLREIASAYYDKVEYRANNPGQPVGIPSGFRDLDKVITGLRNGNFVILGGRPGQGKTSLLLNIVSNAAIHQKKRIAIFSLEMGREELLERFVSADIAVTTQRLAAGDLTADEWGKFTGSIGKYGNLPIYIDDTPAGELNQMRSKCRQLARTQGLDLVVVDYVQLMGGSEDLENRVAEMSKISRGLKGLARDFNVPVLCAAQLSRKVEERKDKRPMLSDLKESGSFEQDADLVLFIYREDQYDEHSSRPNQADILIAKQRKGPTGTVTLYFRKEFTQFTNMDKYAVAAPHWSDNGANEE
jgi:replicative DNA helicase